MSDDKLTARQRAFVAEYLIDLNASAAANRAGYSAHTARFIGTENLAKPNIAAAIAAAQAERAKRTQIDADWVLRRLAALAEADVSDLYGEDGALRLPTEWPEAWRKGLVSGIEVLEEKADGAVVGRMRKVKLADRIKVLELVGRHVAIGAWRDRVEMSGRLDLVAMSDEDLNAEIERLSEADREAAKVSAKAASGAAKP